LWWYNVYDYLEQMPQSFRLGQFLGHWPKDFRNGLNFLNLYGIFFGYIIKAWLIGNAGFRTIVLNMSEHSRNPEMYQFSLSTGFLTPCPSVYNIFDEGMITLCVLVGWTIL
jgi:hypothetical protein